MAEMGAPLIAAWEADYRALVTQGRNLIIFEVWEPYPIADNILNGQWTEKLFQHNNYNLANNAPYMNGFNAWECVGRHNPQAKEGNPTFFRWPAANIDASPNKNITHVVLNQLVSPWIVQGVQLKDMGIARFAVHPVEYVQVAAAVAPDWNGGRRRTRKRRRRRRTRRKTRRKRRRRRTRRKRRRRKSRRRKRKKRKKKF